jgi:hypothetical protein
MVGGAKRSAGPLVKALIHSGGVHPQITSQSPTSHDHHIGVRVSAQDCGESQTFRPQQLSRMVV